MQLKTMLLHNFYLISFIFAFSIEIIFFAFPLFQIIPLNDYASPRHKTHNILMHTTLIRFEIKMATLAVVNTYRK